MFDHVQIKVQDFKKSREFYAAIFDVLGYPVVFEEEDVVAGWGTTPHDMFEIRAMAPHRPLSAHVHVAFKAPSKEAVQQFYDAALAAGGADNGAPGLREYEPGYYAAFVIDPDGHNLEAVFKE